MSQMDTPKKIYLELTSRCNLHCSMCFRKLWFDEAEGDMTDELLRRVACQLPQLASLETVVFGGVGEPLLDARLSSLVKSFHVQGLHTEIITNGSLLTAALSQALVDAGLDRLWISMDGFSAESYARQRLGGRYARLMENIEAFNRTRSGSTTELGLTFVLMPENLHELTQINPFADRVQAEWLNLSHVVPAVPLKKEDTVYDLPVTLGKVRRVSHSTVPPQHDSCPFVRDSAVFVRWDGGVCPCMQLLHNCDTYLYEQRRRVFRCEFGSLAQQSLRQIWDSDAYRSFRELVREFDFPSCTICMGCDDRLENRSDCMHNTFPTCGACLWAEGIIFCP